MFIYTTDIGHTFIMPELHTYMVDDFVSGDIVSMLGFTEINTSSYTSKPEQKSFDVSSCIYACRTKDNTTGITWEPVLKTRSIVEEIGSTKDKTTKEYNENLVNLFAQVAENTKPIMEDKNVWLSLYTSIINCPTYAVNELDAALKADKALVEFNNRFKKTL